MKLQYLKSATVLIEANGVKILTDPWLVDGEYYGAWSHYPPFTFRDETFADIDYIYVSHIHPDHLSPKTFARLDKKVPVLIHQYADKFVKKSIESLGFTVQELPHRQRHPLKNGVHLTIYAADNCDPQLCAKFFGCGVIESKFGSTQIDSCAVIDDGKESIVNTNDCPYELSRSVLDHIVKDFGRPTLLLVGYGGAGPYPQCFDMPAERLLGEAERKQNASLAVSEQFVAHLKPKYVLPFAGTYTLTGRLAKLQSFRGVPEIEDAAARLSVSEAVKDCGAKVFLLNSYQALDLTTGTTSAPYQPVDKIARQQYIDSVLAQRLLDYESDAEPSDEQIIQLLPDAFNRFERKRKEIDWTSETRILVPFSEGQAAELSCNGAGFRIGDRNELATDRYVQFTVDRRLLFRLLRGPRMAHWNNAEIGSHISFRRAPNIFERGLYHCMCFFHA